MSADAVIVFGVTERWSLDWFTSVLHPDFSLHKITDYEKNCGYAPRNTEYYITTGYPYFDKCGGRYTPHFKYVIELLALLVDETGVHSIYYGYDCLDQTNKFTAIDLHDIIEAYKIAERKYNDYASL